MGRRVLIVVGAGLALLLLALMGLPSLLKGRIAARLEAALDEALLADVSYDDVSVSLLRTFPRLGVDLQGLTVVGEGPWEGVALLRTERIDLGLDLWSALFGDTVIIERLVIEQPALDMRVAADGTSNLDLFPPEDTQASTAPWSAALDRLEVHDLRATYVDVGNAVDVSLGDLDVALDGTIGSAGNVLDVHATAASVTARQGEVAWLADAAVALDTVLRSDAEGVITLDGAEAVVNALKVAVSGTVAPGDGGTDLELALEAPEASLAGLLSLVPEAYGEGFDQVEADGTVAVKGIVEGRIPDTGDDLPGFTFEVGVTDGHFRFPGRPGSVKKLALHGLVEHAQGPLDATTIDVSRFDFEADRSAFAGTLKVAHPTTDPDLDLTARGTLDLAELSTVFPSASTGATGQVDLDLAVRGRVSGFQAATSRSVDARGTLRATGLDYVNPDISAVPLRVDTLDLALQGAGAKLESFRLSWASEGQRSDLRASGSFDRFLTYFLDRDGVLSGRLSLGGTHTDIRPWSSSEPSEDSSVVMVVPDNLALDCTLDLGHLELEAMSLDDVRGALTVADGTARLRQVEGTALGGEVVLDGNYTGGTTGAVDFDIRTIRVDLAALVSEFETLRRLAPVLEGAVGELDSDLALSMQLLPDGTPILATLNASGSLRTLGLELKPSILREAATKLGRDDVTVLDLHKARLAFEIHEGRLDLQPFTLKLGKLKATGQGTAQILGERMDLSFLAPMKTKTLKGSPFLASLGADVPREVDVQLRIQGSYAAPKLGLSVPGVRAAVEERIDEALDDVRKAAVDAAKRRGDKLVAEARAQAEAIEAEAARAAQELRKLAQIKGDRAVEEAGDNLVKRAVARESAKAANKQADKAATRIESEASQRAQRLVEEAEAQRDRWVEEAAG